MDKEAALRHANAVLRDLLHAAAHVAVLEHQAKDTELAKFAQTSHQLIANAFVETILLLKAHGYDPQYDGGTEVVLRPPDVTDPT